MTQQKWKKVFCLVLASVMAFSMTACGGVPNKNSSSSSEKESSSSSSSSSSWYSSEEESSSSSSEEVSSSSSEETSSYSSEETSSSSSEKESSSSSEEESSYSSEEESSYSSEEESSSSSEDSSEASSSEPTSSVEEFVENGMPNYDVLPAEDMIFAAWFMPETSSVAGDGHPSVAQLCQDISDCGFNWIFANGDYMGALGTSPIYDSMLDYCDDLDLKVLFDLTKGQDNFGTFANLYNSHKSFAGFNYDEPFLETRPNSSQWLGLKQLNQYAINFAEQYPNLNFLVNLNPIWFIETQSQTYTYGEYVNALMEKVYQPYQTVNASAYKWLSADDYPFWVKSGKNVLAEDWLEGIAYLAQAKKNTTMDNVVTNFFIQAMPFGPKNRNRVMTYKELSMQTYTLMAFGYDAVSFFCYGSPKVLENGEFTAAQTGLVDRNGNKTNTWYDSQKLIGEISKFQHTYMQFNDNWLGVYPVVGSNNSSRADFTLLSNMDDAGFTSPVVNKRSLKGISSITSNEDVLVGAMLDNYRNPGYVVVNYNDTCNNKTATTEMNFSSGYSKAWVYVDGVQQEVALTNGKLTLNLDVGEGVFVIPIADAK